LPEPGGAREDHVVERLAAAARRLDRDAQTLDDARLTDERVQARRPQGAVEFLLVGPRRLVEHHATPPSSRAAAAGQEGSRAHRAPGGSRLARRGRDRMRRAWEHAPAGAGWCAWAECGRARGWLRRAALPGRSSRLA